MSITLDDGTGAVAILGDILTLKTQVGSTPATGFSNIVGAQVAGSTNQSRVTFDYFGPDTTLYVRTKSNYAGEGKDVFGGFRTGISHFQTGNDPVSYESFSPADLLTDVTYTDMLYSDDGVTQVPTGNDVVTSNSYTITGTVAAPTVIYPSTIELVQNADAISTVIATLTSDVAGATFIEGTPDLALVTVSSNGQVPLAAVADTIGSFILKATATTAGGSYNQDVTINVSAAGGGGGTFNVTTAAELTTALNSAVAGDSISMAAGNYGSRTITKSFTDYVTLFSATPENPAVFTFLSITNSAYIKIDGVHVSATSNGSAGGKFMNITDSNHIQVLNSEINGLVDGTYAGSYGLYSKTCDFITYTNCNVHDCNDGIVAFGVSNLTITGCLIDYVFSDFFKLAGGATILIENCTGGGHLFPDATAHADFIQFQGSASNITIRGNLYLAQNNERAQGIFLKDGTYNTVLIENNIVISGKANAAYVSAGTGVTVRKNTLLNTVGLGHQQANISVPSGSTVTDNIRSNTSGSLSGSNVVAQYDAGSGQPYYYATLYTDVVKSLGVTVAGLAPVGGSLAETKGAFERIAELLA